MPRIKRRIIIPEVIEIAETMHQRRAMSLGDEIAETMRRRGFGVPKALNSSTSVVKKKSQKQNLDDRLSKFKFLVGGSNESTH
jgi:hypothetical protein